MSRPAGRLAWLISGLRRNWIDPQEVRAEAWALGGRHRGQVVEGARREMEAPGVPMRRMLLLKAVVRAQGARTGDGSRT